MGATLPGFTVTEAALGSRQVLAGRHRFSEYTLVFVLTDRGETTLLSARTHARFPGPHGRVYRALVIGSGAHRYAVTSMLRGVRRVCEPGAW